MRHTQIFVGMLAGLLFWQLFNGVHPLLEFCTGLVLGIEIILLIRDARHVLREPVVKDGDE